LTSVLVLGATPLAGQVREPEVDSYSFVSEAPNVYGFWVNAGATALSERSWIAGHVTFDRPASAGWSAGQYMLGLQAGPVAFGYRHDEFEGADGFAQGDAYTVALGFETGRSGLGVSRTWRTVGATEGSWEIGWVNRSESGVSVGLVWRDIGSPQVRDTIRRERLVGALTYRPALRAFSLSVQADYRLDGREFRAFRVGGSLRLTLPIEALALAEWDGDGDFRGFRLGVVVRQRTAVLTAGAGLDSAGDARTASAGAVLESQGTR
jgi:hypothetical protein